MIGKDDPSEFKTLATALGIAHRVKFVGPQKLLGPWYRAADVFAFPTSYEAFGMVITEALAAGIPVVVPREAGAAELIEHGKGGYLMDRWDDVNQLTGFLRKLEDDALRAAMGKMARLTAESRTWDDAANETLAVYYRVLKR